jgi:ribosome-binding factor A
MSQRTAKVESLVQQVVATGILELLDADAANITVTGVDVAPDLRSAIVWIGVIADDDSAQAGLFNRVTKVTGLLQRRLAGTITTKFVPRLELRLDTGGQYADHITRLLNNL